MASLEIIQGPDTGRTFELDGDDALIGRQSETVPISDGTVSRRHARLHRQGDGWIIEDAGSVNGTFVNGVRVNRPIPLRQGDQVRVGRTLLVFGGPAAAAPRLDVDENGGLVEASIMATVPSAEDSVIIPTPEAGAEAIENVRILYDLAREAATIFNLDQLLRRVVDLVFDVVQADRAYVVLLGPDGELIPKAARSRGDGQQEDNPPISRTIINEVIRRQVGVLSSNAMRDKRFSSGKSVHDYGIRSAIVAPIKGHERILGILHVDSSVSQHTYTTEQLRLLTAIGYQTGLAAENVRLYEAQVRSERLTAVGETVALLSHHIKNILQGLQAGSDLVENALEKENLAKAGESWPIVRRSLDRINGLILNMLAFSKERKPLLESVNVNFVVSELVEFLTPQADDRGVALMTDLSDLPPIPADTAGLHQALLNLLSNALDAVADATGVVTIATDFDSMDQEVVVRVTDNGVGIEPEEIDHIFEIFHSNKGQKGTGLGLAVVRKVVREHGGRVEVDSQVDQGTTFTVHLPARQSPSGETIAP
jgi:signal transduction histidine kinase